MDSQIQSMARGTRTPPFLILLSALLLSILTFTTSISAQSTSATPTTFQTLQSSTSPSSSNTSPQTASTPTNYPNNPNNATDNNNDDGTQRSAFSYYFLIIAAVIILFGAAALWLRSRQRRKAAIARSSSQRALARDVEGFRSRFNFGGGAGAFGIRGAAYRGTPRVRTRRGAGDGDMEGLDERGEAPPPYVEGTKPPSVLETRSEGLPEGEEVEMRNFEIEPPNYDEHASDGQDGPLSTSTSVAANTGTPSTGTGTRPNNAEEAAERPRSTELTRPPVAVTAPERS